MKTQKAQRHPNSLKNLKPWKRGESGNPGGRPKIDTGAIIARAILENNQEQAYKALGEALLRGNAYVFKELCDRAYGRASQALVLSGPNGGPIGFAEVDATLEELNARLEELMRKSLADPMDPLGQRMRQLVREADAKAGTS